MQRAATSSTHDNFIAPPIENCIMIHMWVYILENVLELVSMYKVSNLEPKGNKVSIFSFRFRYFIESIVYSETVWVWCVCTVTSQVVVGCFETTPFGVMYDWVLCSTKTKSWSFHKLQLNENNRSHVCCRHLETECCNSAIKLSSNNISSRSQTRRHRRLYLNCRFEARTEWE